MEPVSDVSVGEWIRPRLTGRWGSVTSVVPVGYEVYVRVLHPVGRDADRIVRWRAVAAATGRLIHPLVQRWRLIDASDYLDSRSEIWDGGVPLTDVQDDPDSRTLVDILARHTVTPNDAWFALWEGSGHFNNPSGMRYGIDENGHSYGEPTPTSDMAARLAAGPRLQHPGRDYVLLSGPLAAASTIADVVGARPFALSSNLVWPADHAWCIGTEVDFDSTLVGCTLAAADAILSCPELEAMPIGSCDSFQADADLINT